MKVNVDEIGQIVCKANSTNRNIGEVYRGGSTPVLLWPKEQRYYVILTNTITSHYNSGTAISAAGGYVYYTGTIAVYDNPNMQGQPIQTLYDQYLTPIQIVDTATFTKADGTTAPICYIDQMNFTVNNETITVTIVKGDSLENYRLPQDTSNNADSVAYQVTVGYRTAQTVNTQVLRAKNVRDNGQTTNVTKALRLDPLSQHDFIVPSGETINIQCIPVYDTYTSYTWTSGYIEQSNTPTISDQDGIPVEPTTFSVIETAHVPNTTISNYSYDNVLQCEAVVFPASTNLDFTPNHYEVTATYVVNGVILSSNKLEYDQDGGDFVFGNIVIENFFYVVVESGDPKDDDIIAVTGGTQLPKVCTFTQSYSINGDSDPAHNWTLRYATNIISQNGHTVVLGDSRIRGREYTINFANATDTITGAVTVGTKGQNADSAAEIQQGYTIVKTVTFSVTDGTKSNSESAYVYQAANAKIRDDYSDYYTTAYWLTIFNHMTQDEPVHTEGGRTNFTVNLPNSNESYDIIANRERARIHYEQWTATNLIETVVNGSDESWECTDFTITPSSGYTRRDGQGNVSNTGYVIDLDANMGLTLLNYYINSTYDNYSASIHIIQRHSTLYYDDPVIVDFRYHNKDFEYFPITGGTAYPFRVEVTQDVYIINNNTRTKVATLRGSTSGEDSAGGTLTSNDLPNDSATFTVNYTGANSSGLVTVSGRGHENYYDQVEGHGTVIQVKTVSATVTATSNNGTSASVSAPIYQEQNYETDSKTEYDHYEFNITYNHYDSGKIPARDTNNNDKPYVLVTGTAYYYSYKQWADSNTWFYDDQSTTTPIPASLTGIDNNASYGSVTIGGVVYGKLEFNENQSTDDIVYSSIRGVYGGKTSTNSEGVTINAGRYTYGSVSINSFHYYSEKNDNDVHVSFQANGKIMSSNETELVPSYTYSQTRGWNGRTSGAGNETTGGTASFSIDSTKYDSSKTSFDTSTGAVSTDSLGTNETSTETTIVSSGGITLTISMNGGSNSTTYNSDIKQDINDIVSSIPSTTVGIQFGGTWYYGTNINNTVNVGATASGTATFRAKYWTTTTITYRSGGIQTPEVDGDVTPTITGSVITLSSGSYHYNENTTPTERDSVITATYSGVTAQLTIHQSAGEFTFSTDQVSPIGISYTSYTISNSPIIVRFEMKINGNTVNSNELENIDFVYSNWITYINDSLGTDSKGTSDYAAKFSYTGNTSENSERTGTITATWTVTSSYKPTITWNVTQARFVPPTVTLVSSPIAIRHDNDYTAIISSNHPCTFNVSNAPVLDWTDESAPGYNASRYVNLPSSVSPSPMEEYNQRNYTVSFDTSDKYNLPYNYITRIDIQTSSVNGRYDTAFIPLVSSQFNITKDSDWSQNANSGSLLVTTPFTTNYPDLSWTSIQYTNGSDWLHISQDGLRLTADANTETSSRSATVTATGSVSIDCWGIPYNGNSTATITVTQAGAAPTYSISVSRDTVTFTGETANSPGASVTVTASTTGWSVWKQDLDNTWAMATTSGNTVTFGVRGVYTSGQRRSTIFNIGWPNTEYIVQVTVWQYRDLGPTPEL